MALRAGPGRCLSWPGPALARPVCWWAACSGFWSRARAADLLAVTFTRRAAAELRQRLAAALRELPALPRCDTLHGLA